MSIAMSSVSIVSKMYLTFLRPLALPRAATLSRFLATTASNSAEVATKSASKATFHPMLAKPSPEQIAALPYRISRTPSNSLPIYLLRKRGGNLHQTKLRKIEGNIAALRTDLKEALQLEDKDVVINQLTKQIIIRGHRKPDVAKFLEERQF